MSGRTSAHLTKHLSSKMRTSSMSLTSWFSVSSTSSKSSHLEWSSVSSSTAIEEQDFTGNGRNLHDIPSDSSETSLGPETPRRGKADRSDSSKTSLRSHIPNRRNDARSDSSEASVESESAQRRKTLRLDSSETSLGSELSHRRKAVRSDSNKASPRSHHRNRRKDVLSDSSGTSVESELSNISRENAPPDSSKTSLKSHHSHRRKTVSSDSSETSLASGHSRRRKTVPSDSSETSLESHHPHRRKDVHPGSSKTSLRSHRPHIQKDVESDSSGTSVGSEPPHRLKDKLYIEGVVLFSGSETMTGPMDTTADNNRQSWFKERNIPRDVNLEQRQPDDTGSNTSSSTMSMCSDSGVTDLQRPNEWSFTGIDTHAVVKHSCMFVSITPSSSLDDLDSNNQQLIDTNRRRYLQNFESGTQPNQLKWQEPVTNRNRQHRSSIVNKTLIEEVDEIAEHSILETSCSIRPALEKSVDTAKPKTLERKKFLSKKFMKLELARMNSIEETDSGNDSMCSEDLAKTGSSFERGTRYGTDLDVPLSQASPVRNETAHCSQPVMEGPENIRSLGTCAVTDKIQMPPAISNIRNNNEDTIKHISDKFPQERTVSNSPKSIGDIRIPCVVVENKASAKHIEKAFVLSAKPPLHSPSVTIHSDQISSPMLEQKPPVPSALSAEGLVGYPRTLDASALSAHDKPSIMSIGSPDMATAELPDLCHISPGKISYSPSLLAEVEILPDDEQASKTDDVLTTHVGQLYHEVPCYHIRAPTMYMNEWDSAKNSHLTARKVEDHSSDISPTIESQDQMDWNSSEKPVTIPRLDVLSHQRHEETERHVTSREAGLDTPSHQREEETERQLNNLEGRHGAPSHQQHEETERHVTNVVGQHSAPYDGKEETGRQITYREGQHGAASHQRLQGRPLFEEQRAASSTPTRKKTSKRGDYSKVHHFFPNVEKSMAPGYLDSRYLTPIFANLVKYAISKKTIQHYRREQPTRDHALILACLEKQRDLIDVTSGTSRRVRERKLCQLAEELAQLTIRASEEELLFENFHTLINERHTYKDVASDPSLRKMSPHSEDKISPIFDSTFRYPSANKSNFGQTASELYRTQRHELFLMSLVDGLNVSTLGTIDHHGRAKDELTDALKCVTNDNDESKKGGKIELDESTKVMEIRGTENEVENDDRADDMVITGIEGKQKSHDTTKQMENIEADIQIETKDTDSERGMEYGESCSVVNRDLKNTESCAERATRDIDNINNKESEMENYEADIEIHVDLRNSESNTEREARSIESNTNFNTDNIDPEREMENIIGRENTGSDTQRRGKDIESDREINILNTDTEMVNIASDIEIHVYLENSDAELESMNTRTHNGRVLGKKNIESKIEMENNDSEIKMGSIGTQTENGHIHMEIRNIESAIEMKNTGTQTEDDDIDREVEETSFPPNFNSASLECARQYVTADQNHLGHIFPHTYRVQRDDLVSMSELHDLTKGLRGRPQKQLTDVRRCIENRIAEVSGDSAETECFYAAFDMANTGTGEDMKSPTTSTDLANIESGRCEHWGLENIESVTESEVENIVVEIEMENIGTQTENEFCYKEMEIENIGTQTEDHLEYPLHYAAESDSYLDHESQENYRVKRDEFIACTKVHKWSMSGSKLVRGRPKNRPMESVKRITNVSTAKFNTKKEGKFDDSAIERKNTKSRYTENIDVEIIMESIGTQTEEDYFDDEIVESEEKTEMKNICTQTKDEYIHEDIDEQKFSSNFNSTSSECTRQYDTIKKRHREHNTTRSNRVCDEFLHKYKVNRWNVPSDRGRSKRELTDSEKLIASVEREILRSERGMEFIGRESDKEIEMNNVGAQSEDKYIHKDINEKKFSPEFGYTSFDYARKYAAGKSHLGHNTKRIDRVCEEFPPKSKTDRRALSSPKTPGCRKQVKNLLTEKSKGEKWNDYGTLCSRAREENEMTDSEKLIASVEREILRRERRVEFNDTVEELGDRERHLEYIDGETEMERIGKDTENEYNHVEMEMRNMDVAKVKKTYFLYKSLFTQDFCRSNENMERVDCEYLIRGRPNLGYGECIL